MSSEAVPALFENVPCECCGAAQFAIIREWNGASKIVRCLNCSLEFVNPLPGEECLRELYRREAQSDDPANPYYRSYIIERKERRLVPYGQPGKPASKTGKLWHGMKRDLKNLVNPLN